MIYFRKDTIAMDNLIRTIQFPFAFDRERLKVDVQKVLQNNWVDHYNTNDYNGKWTSVALLSQDGKSETIYALPNANEAIKATEILNSCDYFKEILDGFFFSENSRSIVESCCWSRNKTPQRPLFGV
jgi:hypothetical protein